MNLTEPPGREDVTPTYYDRPLLKMPHWELERRRPIFSSAASWAASA